MKQLARGISLALSLIPSWAWAQTPDLEFKFRGGTTLGNLRKDLRNDQIFGLGFEVAIPLDPKSSFIAECGYDYAPGRGQDRLPGRNASIWYNYNGTGGTIAPNGSPYFVAPTQSYGSEDTRNISFEGFSLRGGYRRAWAGNLSWQLGLSLDRYKSKNQFVGYLYPRYMRNGVDTLLGSNEYEGWAVNHERAKLCPGAYAGLSYRLDETYRCEFNLRSIGYGISEFIPSAYSGRPEQLLDKNARGLTAEVVFVVKL